MNKYTKLIVCYFSGTGNAKKVSEWVVQNALARGIPSTIYNIDNHRKNEWPAIDENTLIGICSPTHGFNFPPLVLSFIFRFPKTVRASVFIINTRAGMKLYKLFLPGLSGLAQILSAIVFLIKGYRVVGMQPMDLPSNWISLHPGLRQKVVLSIFSRCKRITQKFISRILDGKRKYKALLSLPFDIAVIPIAMLYYLIGRFALSKTFVATSDCNRCNLCIKQCPVKAIKLIGKRPFWTFNCESCMRCMNHCPQRAIETAISFTVFIWWIIFSIIPAVILWLIPNKWFLNLQAGSYATKIAFDLLHIGATFLILFISYHFVHFLMQFSLFNKIIAYTSLSRYSWWRRYRAPENG